MKSMIIRSVLLLGGFLVLVNAPLHGEEFPPTFPFVVGYELGGAVDMTPLLHAPAGKHGFVRCDGDRFMTDAGEIRFWATNLSGDSHFPTKEYADLMVGRMARLGINCVRLHWMDGYALWGDKPTTLRKIDPGQFDKLDYLIAAFKKRGIYVNMNLHVARWLDDRDGFPHKDRRPKYDKGLDNFEPRMIELQKEFARDLLTHVNPYTGLAYTDEPAVAMIEINNENSVMAEWANGALDDLPDPYGKEFQKQWNDWLRAKYGTTEKMLKAWDCRNYPLGEEMLPGGDFTKPIEFNKGNWIIQLDAAGHADCKVVPDEKLLRITVHRDGKVGWTPQLYYRNLAIKEGEPYTLSFRVRADKPIRLHSSVSMDRDPWRVLGMRSTVDVTPEWKTFTYKFIGTESFDKVRFNFTGMKTGIFEFADFSLRTGGEFGLPENCKLENGTVPLPKNSEQHLSKEYHRDFWRFLADAEWKYWPEMRRFIKDELKAKQPVSGTQLYYGSKHVQASLDYCDDHAYWNHPSWPGKSWDRVDWYVRNRALVHWADVDIFTRLGPRRIAGKPHTISEYNHPFPNQFAAEGLPMICAFSQFQGWNGIFQYTYAHKANIEPREFTGYFDMIAQQAQLVHSPACAAMILRGDVSRAKKTVYGSMTKEEEIEALTELRWPSLVDAKQFGIDGRLSLFHATALDMTGEMVKSYRPISGDQSVFVSDTGQLTWNPGPGKPEERTDGYFMLNTPKTKVFTGFIRGRSFDIGDVKLSFGKTRLDWATVTLTETAPNRMLLAATGLMENTGMKFVRYDEKNPDRMTLHGDWGGEPILCEGIPMTLSIPSDGKTVKCYALDPAGKRKEEIKVEISGSVAVLHPGPQWKTLWYEIVRE